MQESHTESTLVDDAESASSTTDGGERRRRRTGLAEVIESTLPFREQIVAAIAPLEAARGHETSTPFTPRPGVPATDCGPRRLSRPPVDRSRPEPVVRPDAAAIASVPATTVTPGPPTDEPVADHSGPQGNDTATDDTATDHTVADHPLGARSDEARTERRDDTAGPAIVRPSGEPALAVLASAHDAAEKVVADAEREAASIVARAVARADRKRLEVDAEARRAQAIVERAQQVDTEIERRVQAAAAERIAQIDALAEGKLADLDAFTASQRAEVETRTDRLRQQAEEGARARVREILDEGQARLDLLLAEQTQVEARIAEARGVLRGLEASAEQLRREVDGATIDLREDRALVTLDGAHGEAATVAG